MPTIWLRFDERLNVFLARQRRGRWSELMLNDAATLKDVIESLGVPHTEVGALIADGAPAGIKDHVADGLRLEIRAAPPRMVNQGRQDTGATPLQPVPPRPLRFVLDVHLGRLAAYLRMLGFDTWYERHADDDTLAARSAREDRVLLSRDVGLLKRGNVRYGGFVYATDPVAQLTEIIERFARREDLAPFTRCMRCNGLLVPIEKAAVEAALPPRVRAVYDTFARCATCGRIYWEGGHFTRMSALIARVLGPSADAISG